VSGLLQPEQQPLDAHHSDWVALEVGKAEEYLGYFLIFYFIPCCPPGGRTQQPVLKYFL